MKVLHTSDWHLGQKFMNLDREREFEMAMQWLRDMIAAHRPDVLLVSGDVFDTLNPGHHAQGLYYDFLNHLRDTSCRHTVITAGNHDSASFLEAPKALLRHSNVHMVASCTECSADEVLVLRDASGAPELMVGAVPYLRERDLPAALPGEDVSSRVARTRAGILRHFMEVGNRISEIRPDGVPAVCMGHLYVAGSEADERQRNIYLSDRENIQAGQFHEVFDYVALGHIHKAQPVGGLRHVRYSGSVLPLDFSEISYTHGVTMLEFDGRKLTDVSLLKTPVFRQIRRVSGTLGEVTEAIVSLHDQLTDDDLSAWLDVEVRDEDNSGLLIRQQIEALTKNSRVQVLRYRLDRPQTSLAELSNEGTRLTDLDPEQVFLKRLDAENVSEQERAALLATFRELMQQIVQ